MRRNFNTNTENKDEWLTPPDIFSMFCLPFDLDPCAPVTRPWPMAKDHYTKLDDGLVKPWSGLVWCNPPYGKKTGQWLEKLSNHREGGAALVFARTETKMFQEFVFNRATAIFFFNGRLKFYHVSGEQGGTAPARQLWSSTAKKRLDDSCAVAPRRAKEPL